MDVKFDFGAGDDNLEVDQSCACERRKILCVAEIEVGEHRFAIDENINGRIRDSMNQVDTCFALCHCGCCNRQSHQGCGEYRNELPHFLPLLYGVDCSMYGPTTGIG
jgi:hypothetical protein